MNVITSPLSVQDEQKFKDYTSRKTDYPHFTMFYNIALENVEALLKNFKKQGGKKNIEGITLDEIKGDYKGLPGVDFRKKYEFALIELKNFLWKGYGGDKNKSGTIITDDEIHLVVEMLVKIKELRNFHSHIFHKDSPLIFSKELTEKIQKLHDEAMGYYEKEGYLNEVRKYNDYLKGKNKDGSQGDKKWELFDKQNNENRITSEGKLFFLSLFLYRNEMYQVLTMSKGSKNTTTKEFRVKHLIYSHYTLRGGQRTKIYNYKKEERIELNTNFRRELIDAAQGYKILNYLNDVPLEAYDLNTFSFEQTDFNQNGERTKVATAPFDLAKNYNFLIQEFGLFDNYIKIASVERDPRKPKKEADGSSSTLKETYFEFKFEGYTFRITKNNFHKLILDALRVEDKGASSLEYLKGFIENRKELLKIIKNKKLSDANRSKYGEIDLEKFIKSFSGQYCKNNRLKERVEEWHSKFSKGFDFEKRLKVKPFSKLFNLDDFFKAFKEKPFELRHIDFFNKLEEKPRNEDKFVRFAAEYLMDFNIVPNWYFMYETFAEKNNDSKDNKEAVNSIIRKKSFKNVRPDIDSENASESSEDDLSVPRLAITPDNQVVIGIKVFQNENEENKKYFRFVLGHKALKNILIAHFEGKEKIGSFLFDIYKEINALKKGPPTTQLSLLNDKNVIPLSLKIAAKISDKPNDGALRENAEKRICNLINTLSEFKKMDNLKLSNKFEKDKQVMRCYTYFEWNYPEKSEFKFLRQNEYKRLSHKHNSLGNSFSYDFKTDEDYKEAMKRMPNNLQKILNSAKDLNDLAIKVCDETIKLLENWKTDILNKSKVLDKNKLSKLGIADYEPVQDPKKVNNYAAFDIHPILVLKKFYADSEISKLSLSKHFFTEIDKDAENRLIAEKPNNYKLEKYREAILNINLENFKDSVNETKSVGLKRALLIKDALLSKMATAYFAKLDNFSKKYLGNDVPDWSLQSLRKTFVKIEIEDPTKKDVGVTPNFLNLFNWQSATQQSDRCNFFVRTPFHSLSNYLFIMDEGNFKRAALHTFVRCNNFDKLKDRITTKTNCKTDGNEIHDFFIEFRHVKEEMSKVYSEAIDWVKALLEWEYKIVDANKIEIFSKNKDSYLSFYDLKNKENINLVINKANLPQISYANNAEMSDYVDFKELIAYVRNKSFHAQISDKFAYWQLESLKKYDDLKIQIGYPWSL